MHPFLAARGRFAVYLVASVSLVTAVGLLIVARGAGADPLLFVIPLAVLQSFIGLSGWYSCRALPLGRSSATAVLVTHFAGAAVAAALWTGAAIVHADLLRRLRPEFIAIGAQQYVIWYATGVLFYLLAVAVHYLVVAFEQSRDAERRTLALEIARRDAELRALRAQVDPHFLFNTLNSISSLCGSDAAAARRMSSLLADFFRTTLRAGNLERITLREEVDLALKYLAVERVRFGDRLHFHESVAVEAAEVRVPPLLLQPLVENAVRHGVEHRLDETEVTIDAAVEGSALRIRIANQADKDRRSRPGESLGLKNVAERLNAIYGRQARLDTEERDGNFIAEIRIPIVETTA